MHTRSLLQYKWYFWITASSLLMSKLHISDSALGYRIYDITIIMIQRYYCICINIVKVMYRKISCKQAFVINRMAQKDNHKHKVIC